MRASGSSIGTSVTAVRLGAYSRISQYASRIMERGSTPSLLPILRSRQQGELLALLLGDP